MATLWLDRPEKRNALGPAFWTDLPVAMAAIAADPEVRVVVIAARGPHFTRRPRPGRDVGTGSGATPEGDGASRRPSAAVRAASVRADVLRMQASITSVADCAVPVVAAIQGYCLGGGVDLAAACDIRLASADAVFSVRETKVAIVADLGSLQRLLTSSERATWPSSPTRERTSLRRAPPTSVSSTM